MIFEEEARKKFLKGAEEHGDWTDIDPVKEVREELLDLYNYASHDKFPLLLGIKFRKITRKLWKELDESS